MTKYIPKHFMPYQFVSEHFYHCHKESEIWDFFDPNLLILMDKLVEFFGKPIRVNNWFTGGLLDQRGLRDDATDQICREISFNVEEVLPSTTRSMILKNIRKFPELKGLKTGSARDIRVDTVDHGMKSVRIY